jgi:Predicted membrane protein
MPAQHRHDRGLLVIALFKLVKAALLILAGAGALSLLSPRTEHHVSEWLADFSIRQGGRFVERMLHVLSVATPGKLTLVGLASICYGLMFAVEGIGLWLEKRWAEYLTIVVTGLLIPIEVYELVRAVTPVRTFALVVNVAAVAYLIYRLRRGRGDEARPTAA